MTNLSFVWPIEDYWNHYQVKSVLERQDISEHWNKISSAIRGISWDDILNRHTAEYSDRMSISLALTDELNEALIEVGAQSKIPIFSDNNKSSKPFLIEHKLGSIAGVRLALAPPTVGGTIVDQQRRRKPKFQ